MLEGQKLGYAGRAASASPAVGYAHLHQDQQKALIEAAFAKLCGVAPQPASSGRTTGRHRLSRGGDRAANSALYITTIVRMRHHQPTRDYVERRTAEGLSKREIIRCLKRYIAREIYANLPRPAAALPAAEPSSSAA